MSYIISIDNSKDKDVKCKVNIDGPNPTFIPAAVAIGVGDKLKRFEKHLESCFVKDQYLLRYLAFIHKQGKEYGSIHLMCRCKFKNIHALGIKNFLEKNRETLDMMLPYLFPDSGYKAEDNINISDLPEDIKDTLPITKSNKVTLGSLPKSDRDQILNLMKKQETITEGNEDDGD